MDVLGFVASAASFHPTSTRIGLLRKPGPRDFLSALDHVEDISVQSQTCACKLSARCPVISGLCKKGFSPSGRQRDLLKLRPRSRGSLVTLPLQANLQPASEADDRSDSENSNNSSYKDRVSGIADEKSRSKSQPVANDLNKAVRRTAATFAPRASNASKNPAPPGSALYTVFEAQAYVAMALGGALSFNLLLPSDHPDIWRLMGMWSVWTFNDMEDVGDRFLKDWSQLFQQMKSDCILIDRLPGTLQILLFLVDWFSVAVPSLRARDCSKKEKEALNYLFLVIPLLNVTIPILWRSFAAVWSADVLTFFAIYAWKLEWLLQTTKAED